MEKKLVTILLGIVLLFPVSFLYAATAHDWLASQQNSTTGLVDSFEGDNSTVAYTYDQACAVIAFTCEGDTTRAKKILAKYASMQNAEGSWDNGYFSDTGLATSTWRRSGETLWMLLAMNYYTRKTGDTTYVNNAKKAADWLITLQETNTADPRYGSIYGGLTDTGSRETWTSTEHNFDAYSAFYYLGEILNNQYYKDKAQLVYNWLVNQMWNNTTGRFYTGANDQSVYLDPQSWSVVTIGKTGPAGQDFSRAISYAYTNMHITRTYNGQAINGFDYDGTTVAPGGGVWFEGTEQMALAYETIGDMTNANYYHNQTAKVQAANGGVMCAVGDGGDYWPTNFQHNSVATTSWYIFCSQSPRVNPFKPPVPSADTTPPVISGVGAANLAASSAAINWTTNEASDSQLEYGLTTSYGSSSALNTGLVISHSVNLTGLSANTLYHYRVKSKDAAGNLATSSDYSFTTLTSGGGSQTKNYAPNAVVVTQGTGGGSYTALSADDNNFFSENAMQNGSIFYTDWYAKTTITETPASVTKITITFNGHYTSSQAQGLYLYNFAAGVWARLDYETVATTEQTITFNTTDTASYISSTGEIRLRVYSESAGNVCCYADYINFAIDTNGSADTTPPVISAVQSSGLSSSGATLSWTTNENSDSQVEYGLTSTYGSSSALNTSLVLSHSVSLTGLTSSTLYHFRVKSKDAAGNLAASGDYTFTTTGSGTQSKSYQPTGLVVTQGTGGGSYADLYADDNIFFSENAMQNGSLFYTDWYAKTAIAESPASVTKLSVNFNGHYTSPQTQGLYLYNFSTSAWNQINSQTVDTVDQTITVTITTNIVSYISSTGEIRLRVYTERTSNVCCYADYISFAIDYNGGGDTTPPQISAVQSSGITTSAATINWTTNESSDSQVEYGLTTSYGNSTALNSIMVVNHSVNLAGLNSNATYHYRVKSRDAAGNLSTGSDFTFTTLIGATSKDYSPSSVVMTRGTYSGSYTNLKTNDASYFIVTAARTGNTYYNDWYAKTTISEARSKVTKLTITYDGRYNNNQSQGLYLYNFVTSVWARIDYQTVGSSDKTIVFPTTAISSYISTSGEIRMRVYTTSSSSHTCYADFVKFSIDLTGTTSPVESLTLNAAALNGGEAKLYNNLFNPAKGEETRVDYTIDDEGQVTIKIYNIVGELVRTLTDESKPAGSYTDNWNGKNDDGETVASGVYLFQIQAPGIKAIKKAAVIK